MMRGEHWEVREGLKRESTYGTRLMAALPPSFSCSCLCMTRVVYGAILSDAGKRTGASIFRAADLSAELCSKRCSVGRHAVRGDESRCRDRNCHGMPAEIDGWWVTGDEVFREIGGKQRRQEAEESRTQAWVSGARSIPRRVRCSHLELETENRR